MATKTTVQLDELVDIVDRALQKIGVPEPDIEITREVLLYAQIRGNNQGLVKIPTRGVLPRPDAKPVEITRSVPCVAHYQANGSAGMAVMQKAAADAVSLARDHGLGLVGISGRSTSTGAIGYFANQISRDGMVGIVMGGSVKAVAPAGTTEPLLGTNPIAISVPTKNVPVTLDMTTASMAWYGLIEAQQRGEEIPEGIAYGSHGAFTTDPKEAMKGAILAFAGHKGSGLALMIELLTGPLIGGAIVGDEDVSQNSGDLVLAIDPAAFGPDNKTFLARVDRLLERIRTARRPEGVDEILLPGERGDRQAGHARKTNRVSIDPVLFDQLVELADA